MNALLSIWGLALVLVAILGLVALWCQRGMPDAELEMPHWLDRHIVAATPASAPVVKPNVPQWRLVLRHWWYHFQRTEPLALGVFYILCAFGAFGSIGVLLGWRG